MLSNRSSTTRKAWNEACAHHTMLSVRSAPSEPIARSTFCRLPPAMEIASAGEQQRDEGVRDDPKVEEEIHRLLLEHLDWFDPILGDPVLDEWCYPNVSGGNSKDRPTPPSCHLFRIKLSVKTSEALWSHKETPRFFPERAGAFPIRVARLVEDVHGPRLENAGDGSRLGAISVLTLRPWKPTNIDESALVREVAVIRRFHGHGGGLALTSNVSRLGVRLHDKLFLLPSPAVTVIFTFSERWFYVPSKWTEERVYARIGLDFVDIASTLKKLLRTLYQMYEQEEQDKKMAHELQEQQRRRQEELESKPLAYIPLGWGSDDARWESPDQAMHRRYELLLYAGGRGVLCRCVEQEGPRNMRRRIACDGRFVLPLTMTTSLEEAVGFVEGYSSPETGSFTEQCSKKTEKLRPVAMASAVPAESKGVQVDALIFKFLKDRIMIRLDDGTVLTGWNGISVDIHFCDNDVFMSNISKESWSNQILEWRADDDSPIPCGCLLVQLSRKLSKRNEYVTVSEEKELGLHAMFAVETMENEGLVYHPEQGHDESRLDTLTLSGPKLGESSEQNEGEYSLLFPSPGESDWVKVSEPYVPKFPTQEMIREREEMRKEQLKQVMEPITRPVSEPNCGWNYAMDRPGTQVTVTALPPKRSLLWANWPLSDKSKSTLQSKRHLYPKLACLEWCDCFPCTLLQVYALELIVADSAHPCKLDVCGFIAIRDYRDKRRHYIFNREMSDPLIAMSNNGVLLLPIMSSRRAMMPSILLEFDLKMKRTGDGIHSYRQVIEGVSEHPRRGPCWPGGPFWSRVNELSIRSYGNGPIPMMRVKLAMIKNGVEATIELRPLELPSQGISLRCVARTGRISDGIMLFDGRYGGDSLPMQFVVGAELSSDMEIHLEAVSGNVIKRWCMGFEPKFHALFSQAVDFSCAQVLLSVSWSR